MTVDQNTTAVAMSVGHALDVIPWCAIMELSETFCEIRKTIKTHLVGNVTYVPHFFL